MIKIDFQWDLTEENFRAMMNGVCTPDNFGDVRFGEFLVEFRCNADGQEPDDCQAVSDLFIYGDKPEAHEFGYAAWWRGERPYIIMDEVDLGVPHRRSFDRFKAEFERSVEEFLAKNTQFLKYAESETRPYVAWYGEDKGVLDAPVIPEKTEKNEFRIKTSIGDLVITGKGCAADYPGVWIGIERSGGIFDVAMIEVDQSDKELPSLLKAHIYSTDIGEDEPVFDYHADADHIDNYLRGLE